jgi:hypothetical protein
MNQFPFWDLVPARRVATNGPLHNQPGSYRQISRVHSEAICTEVAERLRPALPANPARLPPDLLRLIKRLDSVERGDIPLKN